MPPRSIQIQTGSRLHFGPLSHRPQQGRHFGGIGMMIESPGVKLTLHRGECETLDIPGSTRILMERARENRPDWTLPVTIDLAETIPAHQGLGAGTQLGMAITEGLGRLHGAEELTAEQLAQTSQRGQRSAVGLHGYFQGGFLVDAGHQPGEAIGQLACRLDFPLEWKVLLVTPQQVTGIHGEKERQTFANLASMEPSCTGELCRLTLTELLPAIRTHDFASFASAISQYGVMVGEFFANSQGGIFAHQEMEAGVGRWQKQGIHAIAQSSWGPTVAIFAQSATEADRITEILHDDPFGQTCLIRRTQALNTGRLLTLDPL